MKTTKENVSEKLTNINVRSIELGLAFILNHNPELKQFTVTGKGDADIIKHTFPEFEIKEDLRKRRYAELILNYE